MISQRDKLRDLREAFDMRQSEFARKCGIPLGTLQAYEADRLRLTKTSMWKIAQATGIGDEYFTSEMSLYDALLKYNIDPSKGLIAQDVTECMCEFFTSLENFAHKKDALMPSNLKTSILKHILHIENLEYAFIQINDISAEPLAKNGEVLVVSREKPKNANYIICSFQDEILIKQYFIAGAKSVCLKSPECKDIELEKADFKALVKVYGVIKAKIYSTIFSV